jgi:uncharacterized protein with FMN-binding domain
MKKIALSLFVIAASGAYVLVQPGEGKPSDVLGVAQPADDVPTGSIGSGPAEAISGRQGSAPPQAVPPAEPPPARPADGDAAIRGGEAVASDGEDEAPGALPPSARAFAEPPALNKPVIAPEPAAALTNPAPAAPPPSLVAATPPAAEPPAPALADIPLPRPRPEYRVTKASVTRAIGVAAAGSGYADGTYTGPTVDAYYGIVQVQAVVQGGRLVNIQVLRYPSDRRTSVFINRHALPLLRDEVIRAQSAHVDIVSGATLTSRAFMRSLDAALRQANA